MAPVPYLKSSYFVMAVLFAPFAEEYLFRGLLSHARRSLQAVKCLSRQH
jgi:membrane protease YdiL (CAAX protease family)